MKNKLIKNILSTSVIAALYVVLTLVFSFSSFGAIQVRVSEALVLLSVVMPQAVFGVTLGCLISNLLFSTPIDAFFGTLATFIGAWLAHALRNHRIKGLAIVSSIPPVVVNAVVIGPMITYFFMGSTDIGLMLFNGLTVAIGQAISCMVLGVLLVRTIERNSSLNKYL